MYTLERYDFLMLWVRFKNPRSSSAWCNAILSALSYSGTAPAAWGCSGSYKLQCESNASRCEGTLLPKFCSQHTAYRSCRINNTNSHTQSGYVTIKGSNGRLNRINAIDFRRRLTILFMQSSSDTTGNGYVSGTTPHRRSNTLRNT